MVHCALVSGKNAIEQIAQAKSVCYGDWYRILYYVCFYVPRSHTNTTAQHLLIKATTAETSRNAITHGSTDIVKECVLGAIRRIPTSAGSFVIFPSAVSVLWLCATIERFKQVIAMMVWMSSITRRFTEADS